MKSIFPSTVTLPDIQSSGKGTLSDTLALEFTELGSDFLKGALVVDKRHLRPGGIVNGGVYLAMIETVASVAARCVIHGQGKNSLGIQVSANHLGVAVPGDKLTATARPAHLGRTTHLWEVEIHNQKAKLLSKGTITLLLVSA